MNATKKKLTQPQWCLFQKQLTDQNISLSLYTLLLTSDIFNDQIGRYYTTHICGISLKLVNSLQPKNSFIVD